MQKHHSLLGIALTVLVVWFAFVFVGHVFGWAIHLLWIIIVIAFVWWLLRAVFGFGRRRSM
jgi:hypothetical protein